ncbi:MAG: cob(I)yrinic acid a,c-diamide adenosyltransferase [Synergistales bacterium]|nr:cob(I)yrinic acid a,c-diamide adenosyltransferase [Synergistales bacterium]
MNNKGLVQVYTGDGKGKTTCAIGLAVRVLGHGGAVAIVQFLKGWEGYGEVAFLKKLPSVRLERTGRAEFVRPSGPQPEDYAEAERGFALARNWIESGDYDLVVLDEINVALHYGLLPTKAVLDLLKERPEKVEVVLTGRNAPEQLIAAADLVTEMVKRRHPFDRGVKAREGIEF